MYFIYFVWNGNKRNEMKKKSILRHDIGLPLWILHMSLPSFSIRVITACL